MQRKHALAIRIRTDSGNYPNSQDLIGKKSIAIFSIEALARTGIQNKQLKPSKLYI
jgi:hypothetical protein